MISAIGDNQAHALPRPPLPPAAAWLSGGGP